MYFYRGISLLDIIDIYGDLSEKELSKIVRTWLISEENIKTSKDEDKLIEKYLSDGLKPKKKKVIREGNLNTLFHDKQLEVLRSGFKDNLDKSIPFYKGSTLVLKDLSTVMKLEKFDVVVHLAAFKAAGESMLNPTKYTSNNIIG